MSVEALLESEGEGYVPNVVQLAFDLLDEVQEGKKIVLGGQTFDRSILFGGDLHSLETLDPNAICSFLLEFLRQISDPLFPSSELESLEPKSSPSEDQRLRLFQDFADNLSEASFALADSFLNKIAGYADKGLVDLQDLALGKILFRVEGEELGQVANEVIDFMLAHLGEIYGVRAVNKIQDFYELGDYISSGGYGEVYKVIHKRTKRCYALKRISKKNLDIVEVRRLHTELAILKRVRHPNIVSLKAVCDSPKALYLVMELADGGELLDDVNRQKEGMGYPEKKAREISFKILSAILYLHKLNIVHRDIKPDNVLLAGPTKEIKVTDFGLSKILSGSVVMKTLVGSANYVAPEILNDSPYGPNCDMWSFGCVVYVLLSGLVPFYGDSFEVISRYIKKGSYELPSQRWDRISREGVDFVSRLLVVDPLKRMSPSEALNHPCFLFLSNLPRERNKRNF